MSLCVVTGWVGNDSEAYLDIVLPINGEARSVDKLMNGSTLPNILSTYNPNDVYNVDESELFYKLLPSKSLTLKG